MKKQQKKPQRAAPVAGKRAMKTEADKLRAAGIEASRSNLHHLFPEDLSLIIDPAHPLYDERVHLPVEPDSPLYKDILSRGVEKPVEVRKNGEDAKGRPILQVVDGRQRVQIVRHINERTPDARRKVPVQFVNGDDKAMVLRGLSSNLLRREETPYSKALKMSKAQALGCGLEDIAQACNVRDTRIIEQHLLIMNFIPDVQKAFNGELPAAAIATFAKVPREEQKAALAKVRTGKAKTAREIKAAVKASREGTEYVPPVGGATVSTDRIEKLRSQLNEALDALLDKDIHMQGDELELKSALRVTEYLLGNEDAFDDIPAIREALFGKAAVQAELNDIALSVPLESSEPVQPETLQPTA